MKVSEVLKKRIEELNTFNRIVSYLPKGLEICQYSNDYALSVLGVSNLKKALAVVRSIREASKLSSRIESYYLSSYYDKKCIRRESLRLSYRFNSIEKLDTCEGFIVRFEVRAPSSSLKKLGLKCKVQTVKKEAHVVEASSSRRIVCPV